MTMNLVVPVGEIKFHLAKDLNIDHFEYLTLGEGNYARLYVPPGIWLAFEGITSGTNILMNFASIEHDQNESITKEFVR